MATLVLSTIGTVIAGPIGGAIGATLGSFVDRAILAPHARQEGPRLGDLSVQSSTYGEAIPLVYGKIRTSGNVFWSTGLMEHRSETRQRVGGKGGGAVTTTNYSYTASFAVGLSARPIHSVGRIWADGKLIRDQAGQLTVGGRLRLYLGNERQSADPLMEAALGPNGTPAYRGLAYAVFEDLALAEFANRIPILSFEIIADNDSRIPLGTIAGDLAGRVGLVADDTQVAAAVPGFSIARTTTARAALEALTTISPLGITEDGKAIYFSDPTPENAQLVDASFLGANLEGEQAPRQKRQRSRSETLPGEISLLYLDPSRDYQPSLQRARRLLSASAAIDRRELPVALESDEAKKIAEQRLMQLWTEREQMTVRLPWRYLSLTPGDGVFFDYSPDQTWQVIELGIESGALEVVLAPSTAGASPFPPQAESGAVPPQNDAPHGSTQLAVLDLPNLGLASSASPTLHLAVAGASTGWRRASVYASFDKGQVYSPVADFTAATTMGTALSGLPTGSACVWDYVNSLDVELLHAEMNLESRSEASVLAGANLCLIGDELVQFCRAEPLAPGRYRLSQLLRGRRGTEAAMSGHQAGDVFVLLTGAALAVVDISASGLGHPINFKALSPYQALGEATPQEIVATGRSLTPLSPVHVQVRRQNNGDISITWIRRSRIGFDWIDGADAPLGEEQEFYLVGIWRSGQLVRQWTCSSPTLIYLLDDQMRDFGTQPSLVEASIQQVSALTGPGSAACALFSL